jgi:hypothetical protein
MSIVIVKYSIQNWYEERRWEEIRKEMRVEREEFTAHTTPRHGGACLMSSPFNTKGAAPGSRK